jgi:exosortase E/protease (VPEID-CTERM system)
VNIAPQCSGVEGFALLTVFTLVYAFLFRREIRFPLFFLTVLPAGLAASWVLNIVRIGTLVLIGEHVSPEIAVNGFHSYAGWMFFTLLALALLYIVHAIPALHGGPGRVLAPPPPLERDWAAASILPFVAFMLSGVVAAALSRHPELAYPFRVLCMAAALWLFRRLYATLDWRPDPVALGAGLAVGVMWVALLPAAPAEGAGGLAAALAGLSAAALAVWIVLRIVGTVVLVPLIEELFFRGYILARLDRGGMAWRLLAIAVSTALFALLHGRWLAAGLAGVVFALVYLLRGRVGAAVQAHAAANALVAAWALARGDWTII